MGNLYWLNGILQIAGGGGSGTASIDDINISTTTTYSSSKTESIIASNFIETDFAPLLSGVNLFNIGTAGSFKPKRKNIYLFKNHNSSSEIILPDYDIALDQTEIIIINYSSSVDLFWKILDVSNNIIDSGYIYSNINYDSVYISFKYISNTIIKLT